MEMKSVRKSFNISEKKKAEGNNGVVRFTELLKIIDNKAKEGYSFVVFNDYPEGDITFYSNFPEGMDKTPNRIAASIELEHLGFKTKLVNIPSEHNTKKFFLVVYGWDERCEEGLYDMNKIEI